jgi:hypothetical protein
MGAAARSHVAEAFAPAAAARAVLRAYERGRAERGRVPGCRACGGGC